MKHVQLRAKLQRENATLDETAAQLRAALHLPPKEKPAMDENAIAAALELAAADRYEGDAAQLCAIAEHAAMDQPMLTWWIRIPASRARDWSGIHLRAWTLKYSGLLSHITTGSNLAMCEQCHGHPARLMAGVWYCSGGCAPLPARQLSGPA